MASTIEHYFMAAAGPVSLQASDWFVGRGYMAHTCEDQKFFIRYTEYGKSEEREISDFTGRATGKAIGYGDV